MMNRRTGIFCDDRLIRYSRGVVGLGRGGGFHLVNFFFSDFLKQFLQRRFLHGFLEVPNRLTGTESEPIRNKRGKKTDLLHVLFVTKNTNHQIGRINR
jgi:hypothetical protein